MILSEKISSVLGKFSKQTLEELEREQIAGRKDIKFIFPENKLPAILEELVDDYDILDIDDSRIFNYVTYYFDTDDQKIYKNHVNGKGNRLKIRYRHYCEAGSCFFEIKQKSNKCETTKERFRKQDLISLFDKEDKQVIEEKTPYDPDRLSNNLSVFYKRITLIHKTDPGKITFDTQLRFQNCKNEADLEKIAVAEVKFNNIKNYSHFINFMTGKKIRAISFSKYCTGVVLTNSEAKYNRYKEKMLFINKLLINSNGKSEHIPL